MEKIRAYLEPDLEKIRKHETELLSLLEKHGAKDMMSLLLGYMETDRLALSQFFTSNNIPPDDAQKIMLHLSILSNLRKDIFSDLDVLEKLMQEQRWKRNVVIFFWNGFMDQTTKLSFHVFTQLMVEIVQTLGTKEWRKTKEYIMIHAHDNRRSPKKFLTDVITRASALNHRIQSGGIKVSSSTLQQQFHEENALDPLKQHMIHVLQSSSEWKNHI